MTEDPRTTIETIAPSIEEAIQQGLAQLGVSQDDVEIEVLDEGNKGLFGLGSREARVRLTLKAGTADLEPGADSASEEPTPPPVPGPQFPL